MGSNNITQTQTRDDSDFDYLDFEYLDIGERDDNSSRNPRVISETPMHTSNTGTRPDHRPQQHPQQECSWPACGYNSAAGHQPQCPPPPRSHGPHFRHGYRRGPSCSCFPSHGGPHGGPPQEHSPGSPPTPPPPPPPPHWFHGHPNPHGCHRNRGRHHRGHCDHDHSPNPSQAYTENSSAPRSNVKLYLHKVIAASHAKAGIVATDDPYLDLMSFAEYPGNNATVKPNNTELPGSPFVEYRYIPSQRRSTSDDNIGSLSVSGTTWGRFDYTYKNEKFTLYVAEWAEGFSQEKVQFLVHEPVENVQTIEDSKKLIKGLMLRAGYWGQELRNEVWVFDRGFWMKDQSLWDGMQKANWDDVILPSELKDSLREDIGSFFKSKATYDDIGIAWKRGIIMYGPPGNGKTISLKATMKELQYCFKISPIPTLYVRSLMSWGGEQEALRQIFEKARSVAPCMLVFEDLDSMINPGNRSYFLNQMDGLDDNNGILVVGTTNHLDELDPGIVARPSRFDRKYEFGLPGTGEGGRPAYVEYWRKKLENRPGIDFPETLVAKIVDMTDGFSFAYIKEAFVSTLLLIAAKKGKGNGDDSTGVFEKIIIQQLKNLRKQLGSE